MGICEILAVTFWQTIPVTVELNSEFGHRRIKPVTHRIGGADTFFSTSPPGDGSNSFKSTLSDQNPNMIPQTCAAGIEGTVGKPTMIASLLRQTKRFLVDDSGPTSVEYAVMLALIIIAAIGGVLVVGDVQRLLWEETGDIMKNAIDGK